MDRRTYLASAGIALASPLAGCLQEGNDPGDGQTPTDANQGDGTTPTGDDDDMSIDGRLRNRTEEPRTFEIVFRDEDGDVSTDGEWEVGANSTRRVPAFGRPGATRTFEVSVDGSQASETLEFNVEPTPGKREGYVDVTYDGSIRITFTPRDEFEDDQRTVEEEPRVDEPPHEITRTDPPADSDEREEWNSEYLGENMPTEPSLAFDTLTTRRSVLDEPRLTDFHGEAYRVAVLSSETERDTTLDTGAVDEETRQRLDAVDFEESVLVVVESGYGSGSVAHRWARVEELPEGIHLHGYYTDPYVQTDDMTRWVSVLEVERPSRLDVARVSLTVSEDRRVHFNSTEGVVLVES